MWDYLSMNKQWVFSGIGVFFLANFLGWIIWVLKKKTLDSNVKIEKLKAKRDINIGNIEIHPNQPPKAKEIKLKITLILLGITLVVEFSIAGLLIKNYFSFIDVDNKLSKMISPSLTSQPTKNLDTPNFLLVVK